MNNYTHVQSTPSSTWNVVHNLGTYPVTDVIVMVSGVEKKILPKAVIFVDENTIQVQFSTAFAGKVRAVGAYKFAFAVNDGDQTDPSSD